MPQASGLFPADQSPKRTRLLLYFDESWKEKNWNKVPWSYTGVLAVPESRFEEAVRLIMLPRFASRCTGEVHFSKLTGHDSRESKVACDWANIVAEDAHSIFYFYALGIDHRKLAHEAFGPGGSKQMHAIYNRFFRTAIKYVANTYFPQGEIEVVHVFHDMSEMKEHSLFDWHAIYRLGQDMPRLRFLTQQVEFIDSDHAKENVHPIQSHFIQLTDVLLGATRLCLDGTTDRRGSLRVAESWLPVMRKMLGHSMKGHPPGGRNVFRRLSVSFFPLNKLTAKELEDQWSRCASSFYQKRELLLNVRASGQGSLFS